MAHERDFQRMGVIVNGKDYTKSRQCWNLSDELTEDRINEIAYGFSKMAQEIYLDMHYERLGNDTEAFNNWRKGIKY